MLFLCLFVFLIGQDLVVSPPGGAASALLHFLILEVQCREWLTYLELPWTQCDCGDAL